MKNSVERFSNRVENYVKYRPDYPREILDFLGDEAGFTKSSTIADIGSGTGISSKLFLENGNMVYGIEPNKEMRGAAEKFLEDFPSFKSINGTAENTTLNDKSVDFVVAAQAFHWFDNQESIKEFERILKSNGFLVLIWNERQLDSNEFLREYESLLKKFGKDYEKVRHDNVNRKDFEKFFRTQFFSKTFQNAQTLDFNGMKGRILSSSYMPSEEDKNFAALEKKLKPLFADYEENGKIKVLYDTKIFCGRI